MRVFVSWSGAYSRRVADALSLCITRTTPALVPWISTGGIGSGGRWSAEIDDALRTASAAIVVVTRANLLAPWLIFEAGALIYGLARHRVCPVLVDLSVADIGEGHPFRLYQARPAQLDGFARVLRDFQAPLDPAARVSEAEIRTRLVRWWPEVMSVIRPKPSKLDAASLDAELTELGQQQLRAFAGPIWTSLILTRTMVRAAGDAAGTREVDQFLATLAGTPFDQLHPGFLELLQARIQTLNKTAIEALVEHGVYAADALDALHAMGSTYPSAASE